MLFCHRYIPCKYKHNFNESTSWILLLGVLFYLSILMIKGQHLFNYLPFTVFWYCPFPESFEDWFYRISFYFTRQLVFYVLIFTCMPFLPKFSLFSVAYSHPRVLLLVSKILSWWRKNLKFTSNKTNKGGNKQQEKKFKNFGNKKACRQMVTNTLEKTSCQWMKQKGKLFYAVESVLKDSEMDSINPETRIREDN